MARRRASPEDDVPADKPGEESHQGRSDVPRPYRLRLSRGSDKMLQPSHRPKSLDLHSKTFAGIATDAQISDASTMLFLLLSTKPEKPSLIGIRKDFLQMERAHMDEYTTYIQINGSLQSIAENESTISSATTRCVRTCHLDVLYSKRQQRINSPGSCHIRPWSSVSLTIVLLKGPPMPIRNCGTTICGSA